MQILGIGGSLRKGSYNMALLRAARELAPSTVTITIYEGLGDIPIYNADVEAQGIPQPVQRFKEAIRAADALLIATPEYNYNIPGMLKNAIDWASRPPADNPFAGKPVGIIGASPGIGGTVRAQLALRQAFVFLNGYVMPRPELLVFRASEKIDGEGNLTDKETRKLLQDFIPALADWASHFRKAKEERKAA